jgi:uncharacterized protein (DUF305 family)
MARSFRSRPIPSAAVALALAAVVFPMIACGRKAAPPPPPVADTGAPTAADQRAARNASDLEFLDAMTRHHQQAIEIATGAQAKLKDPELKAIADSLAASRPAEIDRLRAWRDQWFADAPVATPAAAQPTAGGSGQLATMAAGSAYDALFAKTLADHHQAGIATAEAALPQLRRKPLKRMARQFIRAQQPEAALLLARSSGG